LLRDGFVAEIGHPEKVVALYLREASSIKSEMVWEIKDAPGNEEFKLLAFHVYTETGGNNGIYMSKENIFIEFAFELYTTNPALCVGFDLVKSDGSIVLRSYQTDEPQNTWPKLKLGYNRWTCRIQNNLLNSGIYYIYPRISMHNQYWIINIDSGIQFQVVLDHGVSPYWNTLDYNSRPGVISPILNWTSQN
jgi:hypothetical protein